MANQRMIKLPYQPTERQVNSLQKEVTRLMSVYDQNVVKPTNPSKLTVFKESRKAMRTFIEFELRVDWYLGKKDETAKRVKSIEGIFDGSVFGVTDFYTLMQFENISSLQKAFSYLNHKRNVMLQAEYLPAETSSKPAQKVEKEMIEAWDIEKRNIAPSPTIAKNQKAKFVSDWILRLRHKEQMTLPSDFMAEKIRLSREKNQLFRIQMYAPNQTEE